MHLVEFPSIMKVKIHTISLSTIWMGVWLSSTRAITSNFPITFENRQRPPESKKRPTSFDLRGSTARRSGLALEANIASYNIPLSSKVMLIIKKTNVIIGDELWGDCWGLQIQNVIFSFIISFHISFMLTTGHPHAIYNPIQGNSENPRDAGVYVLWNQNHASKEVKVQSALR